MRIRDKIITAACLTPEGIEWTSLKTKQGKTERMVQEALPFPEERTEGASLATVELPDNISGKMEGDITASIRTAELILRTMEFPTADPEEIAAMASFQIDKVAPYPLDQLAIAHEVLCETENGAMVLMAAAKRNCIDTIGESFKKQSIHIHSIDARILGWLELISEKGHLKENGCHILIVDDGIDSAIAVLADGIPYALRTLEWPSDNENIAAILTEEINYTLVAIDTEHNLPTPESIDFWTLEELRASTLSNLGKATGLEINQERLITLPPLSEGIAQRAHRKNNRLELIPREWIEHEQKKQLNKRLGIASASIGTVWVCALAILLVLMNIRNKEFTKLQNEERKHASWARTARMNKMKLKKLEEQTDNSRSALECLLETTTLLPDADIEFSNFKYEKKKGEVQVRGSAGTGNYVDDYFIDLSQSELFEKLKSQQSGTQRTRGASRATYSVTLQLPSAEDNS